MDVPQTCGLLSDRELEITQERDVEVCLAHLRSGHWTSLEVTTAVRPFTFLTLLFEAYD